MKKIAIIGAGISGLFIANLFKKNPNYQITIYEKSNSIKLEDGYGIQLSVNSVKLLNKIEFNKLQNNEKFTPEKINFYSNNSLNKICELNISNFNSEECKYTTLKRSTLINFLKKDLGDLIKTNHSISKIDEKDQKIKLSDWIFTSVAVVLCSYLIFEQPDLGTAIIVLTSGLIPIFLAGLPYKIILSYLLAVGILSPYVWSNLLDYQKQRVLTYFDSNVDPLGDGWNIAQSQTAIGSGGVFGKGYLQGSQSQLNFIPESHSDFIFSVIGEEFGLIGIFILFLVYGFIIWRVFSIGFKAQSNFERLVCSSLGFIFLLFILINVSMVIGLIPVVGVPLPLISQGGTSIVVHLLAFGVILSTKRVHT